jgi:hypothetical protein
MSEGTVSNPCSSHSVALQPHLEHASAGPGDHVRVLHINGLPVNGALHAGQSMYESGVKKCTPFSSRSVWRPTEVQKDIILDAVGCCPLNFWPPYPKRV